MFPRRRARRQGRDCRPPGALQPGHVPLQRQAVLLGAQTRGAGISARSFPRPHGSVSAISLRTSPSRSVSSIACSRRTSRVRPRNSAVSRSTPFGESGGFWILHRVKEINLSKQDEDFGQTLGVYGLGQGFYINWPMFGPSSPRDTVGLVGDLFLHSLHLS